MNYTDIKKNKYFVIYQFFKDELRSYKLYLLSMFIYSGWYAFDVLNRSYSLKKIIDIMASSYTEKSFSLVLFCIIIFFSVGLITHTIGRLYEYYINAYFLPLLKKNFTSLLFNRLLLHGNKFYQHNLPGSLTALIGEGAYSFSECIKVLIEDIFFNVVLLISSFSLLYKLNIMCGMIMTTWIIVFFIASFFLLPCISSLSEMLTESHAKVRGTIVDCLSNIASIRFFTQKKYEKRINENNLEEAAQVEYNLEIMYMKLWAVYSFGFIFAMGVCVFYLIRGWALGVVTPGDFILAWTINMNLGQSTWKFARDFGKLPRYFGNIYLALKTIMKEVEIIDEFKDKDLLVSEATIEFRNVVFFYEARKKLFNNLSITIKSQEKVGLVGLSGSGKSTFVNLLLRIYDINDGVITIDNQDIKHVGLDFLRKYIAIIPQEPILFHRSIKENIRYGNKYASDDAIIEAAKKAHAHEFIELLSEGYDTIMGERGSRLSGGQRQRIAIARAILKNAPILILDEATSQLDSITEGQIQESIDYVMKNKTAIVIAHRLSTLANMDRILVFDHGEIVQDGSHEELINKKGIYKTLWETQAHGFLEPASEKGIFEAGEL